MASTSTATPSMIHVDARLDSFKAVRKPKNKAKPAFPLDAARYPRLTPTDLANAGFFHDPGEEEDTQDTCKCFICGLQLGGWDETDDPFEEHYKRGSCAWAEFVCGPIVQRAGKTKLVYKTADDLPSSESSATYREITYLKAWPHKAKAGFQPTVKNVSIALQVRAGQSSCQMAKAGFVLQATSVSPDGVWCPFCEYGVEGWEADDDPLTIHQKKSPTCEFFTAQLVGVPPSKGKMAKAPRKTIKRAGRATEVASQAEVPTDAPETSGNEASGSQPKPRRKAPTRGKAKKAGEAETETDLESVADTEAVGDEEHEQAVPIDFGLEEDTALKPKSGPKGRKGKGKGRQTQMDEVPETELASQAESAVDRTREDQDEEKPQKPGAKKSGRKKTIGAKAAGPEDAESLAASEVDASEIEAESAPLGKSTRTRPARRGKTRRGTEDADIRSGAESVVDVVEAPGAEETDDGRGDRRATIKSGKSKSASKSSRTKRAPKLADVEDTDLPVSEVEEGVTEQAESSTEDRRKTIKSSKSTKSKSSSKSTRSKTTQVADAEVDQSAREDGLSQTEEVAGPARAKKSKAKSKSKSSQSQGDAEQSEPSSSRSKSARSAPASIDTAGAAPSGSDGVVESSQADPSAQETEERSKSVPAPRKVAPKPRKTKKASAPPISTAPSSAPAQPHVLTQLDRFANVPPSSPFPTDDTTTPKAKQLSTASKPTRPSPATQLSRETLNASITRGADEARAVVEQVVLHVTRPDDTDANQQAQQVSGGKGDGALGAKLTKDEMQMTLEELVRLEYKKRYEVMQREGEEMIERWEARTSEARSKIEAL